MPFTLEDFLNAGKTATYQVLRIMSLRKDLAKSSITPSEAEQKLHFKQMIRNSIKKLQQQQPPPVESVFPLMAELE